MLENKRLDIMGFVASLDMGSEKMVMALGEKSGSDCRLVGVISCLLYTSDAADE